MMNPKIKAKWVAALRSGEYKQTTEALQIGDRFCCLGVLCDLYAKERGLGETAKDFEEHDESLPNRSVVLWAGLPDENPDVQIGGLRRAVAKHNDGYAGLTKRTFAEIADAIEEQL